MKTRERSCCTWRVIVWTQSLMQTYTSSLLSFGTSAFCSQNKLVCFKQFSKNQRLYLTEIDVGNWDMCFKRPLWSSGQGSWLQIQRSEFDFWYYQIFWELVGLEQGPFSLVSTIEELRGRKISYFGLENLEYGRRDPSCWPPGTLCLQKLALTSPTSNCSSVGTVHSSATWLELEEWNAIYIIASLPSVIETCKFWQGQS
jgi:hypothetical protein